MKIQVSLALLYIVGILLSINLFFRWSERVIMMDKDKPNSVLGYNLAFDFMAWIATIVIITISFSLYLYGKNNDLITLILGISIGSVLTRTPSFKDKG